MEPSDDTVSVVLVVLSVVDDDGVSVVLSVVAVVC